MSRFPWGVVLAAATWCGPAPGQDDRREFVGEVVGVSDGDTLTVLRDRTPTKVRLHGVDAPESGQAFGAKAKQATSSLAFGSMVTVKVRDVDRYGRTVAEVELADGRSLNHEMVRQGLAWWYEQYAPRDRELARLQDEAKAAGRGLWSDRSPTPPWEWRKDGGVPVDAMAGVVGNRNSRVYHAPGCRSVGRTKAENRVSFGSAIEAERAGFKRAGDCRP